MCVLAAVPAQSVITLVLVALTVLLLVMHVSFIDDDVVAVTPLIFDEDIDAAVVVLDI